VFYADHPEHFSSTKVFVEQGIDGFCARRTLGELYATLTGLPLRPRISGPDGMRIVNQIRDRLTLISLTESEYLSAIEAASSQGVVGAAAYDMLIARCALKAEAEVLLTWNVRDFARFGPAISQLVRTPSQL
jgi:predicted nucleic acid-binding protein